MSIGSRKLDRPRGLAIGKDNQAVASPYEAATDVNKPLEAIITASIIVVEIATVALRLTGLGRKQARFQALSAFTGTGFTTTEAEGMERSTPTANHHVSYGSGQCRPGVRYCHPDWHLCFTRTIHHTASVLLPFGRRKRSWALSKRK